MRPAAWQTINGTSSPSVVVCIFVCCLTTPHFLPKSVERIALTLYPGNREGIPKFAIWSYMSQFGDVATIQTKSQYCFVSFFTEEDAAKALLHNPEPVVDGKPISKSSFLSR